MGKGEREALHVLEPGSNLRHNVLHQSSGLRSNSHRTETHDALVTKSLMQALVDGCQIPKSFTHYAVQAEKEFFMIEPVYCTVGPKFCGMLSEVLACMLETNLPTAILPSATYIILSLVAAIGAMSLCAFGTKASVLYKVCACSCSQEGRRGLYTRISG